jgi:(2Fe-2S) ferredoxin
MTLKDSHKSTCLQVLEAGPVLCASQDGRTTAQYGQQVAHANLSARQAKENNLMMSGTYGPPFIGLQASNALSLYLANSLRKDAEVWIDLVQTDMESLGYAFRRRRFRLRASVRRTSGSVLTGWPTPTASNTKNAYQDAEKVIARKLAGRQSNLQDFACLAGWPTLRRGMERAGIRGEGCGTGSCQRIRWM